MKRFVWMTAVSCAAALPLAARAGVTNDFSTNPLTNAAVLKQGPDAANAGTRFTYNSGDGTLTAHYDSTAPTIKLVFPLGEHFNQNISFSASTSFKILSGGYLTPADFSSAAPSFGLINSLTTGNIRASTSDATFATVTEGNAYDLMTFDYFPVQPGPFGGNSINLSTVLTAEPGSEFNSRLRFGFAGADLAFDQSITVLISYDAGTHVASVDWGTGAVASNLGGAPFDVDSFAILLWSDPNLNPAPPAVGFGEPVGGNVVFDSFSVSAVPEPASMAFLVCGMLGLAGRRLRRV